MAIVVSYATTDHEAVAIHHFLCCIAGPILPGPIDPHDSIHEVWRIVNQEIALIAWRDDGQMIGTIGLTRMPHWWNRKVWYLVNRWAFTAPGSRCWKPLLTECRSLARDLDVECTIVSEKRQRLTIFNKSKLRG